MVLTTHVQTKMSLRRANYTFYHLHERKVDNTFLPVSKQWITEHVVGIRTVHSAQMSSIGMATTPFFLFHP